MTELEMTVSTVVVYPDRARITRSGSISLNPGSHRLEVRELPLKLDAASVRAAARGTARARLLGVDVRREFYVETPVERVRELEDRIEGLEDEVRSLDARAEWLQQERATLSSLGGQTELYARGLAYGRIDAQTQMNLLDSLRERTETLDGLALDLAVRRRALERDLKKLRGELEQLRGSRGRERYTGIVEVEVTQPGDLSVELTYVVSGAGWKPLYDLRLMEQSADSPSAALEITYIAQVTQQTGEDWSDVTLTLSTARPALTETLPQLEPWYIAPIFARAPQMMALGMAAPAPPDLDMADFAARAAPESGPVVAEAETAMVAVDASGAAVTYRVSGVVSVPADGAPHKVTVARFDLAPKLDYVTAPKLIEEAYRRARVTNDSPYTLLPGVANLFAGDEFIGATELELTAPNGEVELYLGTDDRVQVERELKRREVDKKLLGDRRRLRYGYEIELENLLPTEVTVTLQDQFPVPRHEDIKVRLESADPKPTEQSELNLLAWELVLAPDEERTVRFDFVVEYPREMDLTGLP
ncbi:MAG TPA: mucoidy inhibitor MuiA family protein [Chloroflexi bacterium]|nr:mucoidy inhibitor MuiA family protein [Chloroflexota bacterium]